MGRNQVSGTSRRDHGRRRRRAAVLGSAGLVAGLAVALVTGGSAPASSAVVAGGGDCTYRDNIQVILDNSDSTRGTDPNRIRADIPELFLLLQREAQKRFPNAYPARTVSVDKFGTTAAKVVDPTVISDSTIPGIITQVDNAIASTDGLTSYNRGFASANATNPAANGRIFTTDGGHNHPGPYDNSHRLRPDSGSATAAGSLARKKTVVEGINVQENPDNPDAESAEARLQRIANETDGKFLKLSTFGEALPATADAFAILSCLKAKSRTIAADGPGKTYKLITFSLKGLESVQTTVTLSGVLASIDVLKLIFGEKKGLKHKVSVKDGDASTAAKENCKDKKKKSGQKKPKAKVSCTGTSNFLTVQLDGKKGKSLTKAFGKKLVVKAKLPKTLAFPVGTEISGQTTAIG